MVRHIRWRNLRYIAVRPDAMILFIEFLEGRYPLGSKDGAPAKVFERDMEATQTGEQVYKLEIQRETPLACCDLLRRSFAAKGSTAPTTFSAGRPSLVTNLGHCIRLLYPGDMALIRSYERGARSVRVHRSLTDCTYQIVYDGKGAPVLALSTFGSDDRVERDKVSQSMQFNEATARLLMASISEAFPSLRPETFSHREQIDPK